MKGGIRIASDFYDKTPEAAFNFFMGNLEECRILTDYSISCITFICTLKPSIKSPYQSTRSTNFNISVKKLLLKIFLSGDELKSHPSSRTQYIDVPTREYLQKINEGQPITNEKEKRKEVTSSSTLLNEIKLQQNLYNASFMDKLTPCEPICPAIITYQLNLTPTEQKILFAKMTNTAVFKPTTIYDMTIVTALFENKLSFIVMEMLENFITLHDIKYHPIYSKNYEHYMLMAAWEYARLCKVFGISHNDAHSSNVMIDPTDKTYFGGAVVGRAIIIDFGRSEINKPFQSHMNMLTALERGPAAATGMKSAVTLKNKKASLWKRMFTSKRKARITGTGTGKAGTGKAGTGKAGTGKAGTSKADTETGISKAMDSELMMYPLNTSKSYADALSCGASSKWGNRSFLNLIMKIDDLIKIMPHIRAHPQTLQITTTKTTKDARATKKTKTSKNNKYIINSTAIKTKQEILIENWTYYVDFLQYLTRQRFKVAQKFLKTFEKKYKLTFAEVYQSLLLSQNIQSRAGGGVGRGTANTSEDMDIYKLLQHDTPMKLNSPIQSKSKSNSKSQSRRKN
jgi:hypothetical protein